jgi:hypothetical protein
MSQSDRAAHLRALHDLHDGRPLVLPNAWDAASARVIELAGAAAIATTSAGVSWTFGRGDGQTLCREEMLGAVGHIARTVAVPVTADVEGGWGCECGWDDAPTAHSAERGMPLPAGPPVLPVPERAPRALRAERVVNALLVRAPDDARRQHDAPHSVRLQVRQDAPPDKPVAPNVPSFREPPLDRHRLGVGGGDDSDGGLGGARRVRPVERDRPDRVPAEPASGQPLQLLSWRNELHGTSPQATTMRVGA